jgi:hypothetical protein
MSVPVSKEILLGAHWAQTPEGRPFFDLYCAMPKNASRTEVEAMRSAMRAGLIRWCLDKARIFPELITE